MNVSLTENNDRVYFFDMPTHYSKENNVHETEVSELDGILPGDTCVSLILLNRPIFHKINVSPTGKL
jgi:uncharacterized membrane protein